MSRWLTWLFPSPEERWNRSYGWWLKTRSRTRLLYAFMALVPVTFIGIGYWGVKSTFFDLPHEYSVLMRRGEPMIATFAGCRQGFGSDDTCHLQLPGSAQTWNYSQNLPQFKRLNIGAAVPVLIDPNHPATRSTALDVARRTNAGFGVLSAFSVLIGVAGLIGLPWVVRQAQLVLRARHPSRDRLTPVDHREF